MGNKYIHPRIKMVTKLITISESELAALRADAERYRWLRANGKQPISYDYVIVPWWEDESELDATIDAAMKAG